MKTIRLIIGSLLLTTVGPGLLAAESCCAKPPPVCCVAGTPKAQTPTDKSIYQLEGSWTNDAGQVVKLEALRGRPQIVAMFFANCQYACPLLVLQMQQIQAALPDAIRTNVGLVLVSFDTQRDSVAALHTYRQQHALDSKWTLLRGSPDDVMELAAVLGVQFKMDATGQFIHSNVITLLNSEGEITFQKTGLDLETEKMVQQVRQVAASN